MGSWGPGVFSDGTACDIRTDYRELLEDDVEDAEVTRRVIEGYQHLGEDEAHVLWLALAAAQAAVGRLDESVKTEALRILDEGIGLELWTEAGSKELAARRKALARLRETLTGPQKGPVKVRRPWSHVTDLSPGDVLAYPLPDTRLALFRVDRLDAERVGTAPILSRLDWRRASTPSRRRLSRLKALPETRPMGGEPSAFLRVARHRKKDEDWSDTGFTVVGQVTPPVVAKDVTATTYTTWRALRTSLDDGWG